MPRAIVLNTAAIAGATGGTWGDSFAANSGDTLQVATFQNGGARILEAWAIDSDSVAEIRWYYTRQDSTHDQSFGMRFLIPALALGGAATNAAFNLLPGLVNVPVYSADTPTIQATSTNADDLVLSWLTEYDDLMGQNAIFIDADQAESMRKSTLGLRCNAVASGTAGSYGAARALNTDDAGRLHTGSWYAILGITVQTQVTTVAIQGPTWGGYKIGLPAGSLDLRSDTWFLDQSRKWGKAMIPVFSATDAGGINVYVADAEASTSPKIDFLLYELNGPVA